LAAGVDALRAPAEQRDGAVGVDGRPISRDRVAHAIDLPERRSRLRLISEVAEWDRAGDSHQSHLSRARLDVVPCFVDDPHAGVGRANGSPTMTMAYPLSRSTSAHSSSQLRPREGSSTVRLPKVIEVVAPASPVPCISGQAGITTT